LTPTEKACKRKMTPIKIGVKKSCMISSHAVLRGSNGVKTRLVSNVGVREKNNPGKWCVKVRKTTVFVSKTVVFMVAGGGLEPPTSGL